MSAEDMVSQLLLAWEESTSRGDSVTPEDLCRDHPELLHELKHRIGMLKDISPYLVIKPSPYGAPPSYQLDKTEGYDPQSGFVLKTVDANSRHANKTLPSLPGYQFLEQLGHSEGGMGEVYKAFEHQFDRYVAVKLLPVRSINSITGRARFKKEAKVLAQLRHPNIITIYSGDLYLDQPYFSMAYYPKGSLLSNLHSYKHPSSACRLIAQVARAVDHAHSHGILHRDLKPGNILIDESDKPIVSDFGLAKIINDTAYYHDNEQDEVNIDTSNREQITIAGLQVGTLPYMAPEQYLGFNITNSTDIWAIGVILFELLTGSRPFKGADRLQYELSICNGLSQDAVAVIQRFPLMLRRILNKCLAVDPEARYTSAKALADDLDKYTSTKSRRWVLTAMGASLGIAAFEIGRRLRTQSTQENQTQLYRANCEALRKELTENKKVELIDADFAPKAYHWRIGNHFEAPAVDNGLLVASRDSKLIEIIDYISQDDFVLESQMDIRSITRGANNQPSGVGLCIGMHEVYMNGKCNYIMIQVLFTPGPTENIWIQELTLFSVSDNETYTTSIDWFPVASVNVINPMTLRLTSSNDSIHIQTNGQTTCNLSSRDVAAYFSPTNNRKAGQLMDVLGAMKKGARMLPIHHGAIGLFTFRSSLRVQRLTLIAK